jgi:hypothetical protein
MNLEKKMLAAVLSLFILTLGCGKKVQEPSDRWEYPLHFGASRTTVHRLLGHAARTTEELEEYPMSGITIWLDWEHSLTKFRFQGKAGALFSGPDSIIGTNWIPSDKRFYSGLTAHSSEDDFKRVLGPPVREYSGFTLQNGARDLFEKGLSGTNKPETRLVWREAGFVIDALFLASGRTEGGKTFEKGSLLWCEVSKGL